MFCNCAFLLSIVGHLQAFLHPSWKALQFNARSFVKGSQATSNFALLPHSQTKRLSRKWVESTLKHVEKNINWLSYGNLINPALNAKECLSSGEEGKVAVHEFLNDSASSEDVISLWMYWDTFIQNLNCQKSCTYEYISNGFAVCQYSPCPTDATLLISSIQ